MGLCVGCGPESHEALSPGSSEPGTTSWPADDALGDEVPTDLDLVDADVRFVVVDGRAGALGYDVDFVGDVDGDGLDDVVLADRDHEGERRRHRRGKVEGAGARSR